MKYFAAAMSAAISLWAAATPALAQSPAQLAAAEDMLVAMDGRAQYEAALVSTLDTQLAADPSLMPYRDVMLGFFQDFVSWEKVRGDYARVYAERFSEPELRELAAFYRTPLGRRFAEESVEVGGELALINMRIVEANEGELIRRIVAASAGE